MNTRRALSYLLVLSVLIFLFVGNVEARTHDFVVQPEQEVTLSSPTLTSPDRVIGNMSVQDGFVEFYITSPTGRIVFCHNQTADADFDFIAQETGNYTFHFINSLLTENATVVLNYRVDIVRTSKIGIDVGSSVGTAIVTTPVPPPPPPDDLPELENLYEKYLNFREAEKIVKIIRDVSTYMPLGSTLGMIGISSLTLLGVSLLYRTVSRRRRCLRSSHSSNQRVHRTHVHAV